MAFLETSFLIDLMRNKKDAVELFTRLEETEPSFLIATPTLMELWEGALLSDAPAKEKSKIEGVLFGITPISFHAEEAKQAAEILVDLAHRGKKIESTDVMIAATAQTHHELIVTRDEHFTRIPGLRVLKY